MRQPFSNGIPNHRRITTIRTKSSIHHVWYISFFLTRTEFEWRRNVRKIPLLDFMEQYDIGISRGTYRYENIIQGSPQMEASAIVPGPAFVTNTSEAFIYSSILLTKPLMCTLTFEPQLVTCSNCSLAN